MGSAITIDGVSKRFRLYHERNQSLKSTLMRRGRARFEEFWALRDVSFEIPEGQTFGLIGHNGSGKSTLLKCMARIYTPEQGEITTRGRVSALLELGTGFHPELSGRENIFLNGAILGLRKADIERKLDDIIDFADIGAHIDTPIKNYSSGMYVRLGFSIAINVEPDILLVDEVLAVGDEGFQRKCAARFEELRSGGRTVVVVSHSLNTISMLCDTVALLDHGRLDRVGSPKQVIEDYLGNWVAERDEGTEESMRWGTREVRIEAVEVLDESGRPVESIPMGASATFRLHYAADIELARPLFTVAVHHVDGTLVSNPNTAELGQVPPLARGRGSIDYTVPSLRLIPGAYDLSGGVLDGEGTHVYDRRHRVLRFHVERGHPDELSGIVSLGGRFEGEIYGGTP
ncbi:MAG: ABC transporter ATP-binding protein [Acidimicrobiia bacterium]|nr:ABC transporter ATP-binding protein [Acidimicrobiia bacterium]